MLVSASNLIDEIYQIDDDTSKLLQARCQRVMTRVCLTRLVAGPPRSLHTDNVKKLIMFALEEEHQQIGRDACDIEL